MMLYLLTGLFCMDLVFMAILRLYRIHGWRDHRRKQQLSNGIQSSE